ncbi:hypothetical protein A4A49_16249 [Nicotiana attenuata]|uniref:Uncharacterized protein n=1 Tax=Nicotiana attenuata TaxID=49451 RepID=A0A314KJS8_NICAT|nr:hypothetical protein A4A49_16249 [Nicotiana attenuata]
MRNNRYQRDKNGHIIEAANDKEDGKLKEKAKDDTVATKNSFDVLEVEDSVPKSKNGSMVDQGQIKEQIRVKKESVEKVLHNEKSKANMEKNVNPTPTGIANPMGNGIQSAAKDNVPNPTTSGNEKANIRESTLECVHRNFGTNKEELRRLNVPVNHLCQEIPSQTFEESDKNGEIEEATVEGDPVEDSGNAQVENVPTKVIDDIVRSNQEIADGKLVDLNGTLIPALPAIVNPNLSSVYELQFKVMQKNMGVMEKNSEVLRKETRNDPHGIEQAIVLKNSSAIEALPMACASVDIQNAMVEQRQFEDERDDESTTGNFKDMAKESNL